MFKKASSWVFSAFLMLTILAVNAYYRWDQKFFAPIAYEVGMNVDWYKERNVAIEKLNAISMTELEDKLERQGFQSANESGTWFASGFHSKEDGKYWYLFKIDKDENVYHKDFSIAWGLCSQTVGVAISPLKNKSVRLLNPGGSCV